MNGKYASRGFSLIELLVVIAILGVVSTVGFMIYGKMTTCWGDLRTRTSLERQADNVLDSMRKDFGSIVSTKLIANPLVGEKSENGDSVVSFPVESMTPSERKTASVVQYKRETVLKRVLFDPLRPESPISSTIVGGGVSQFLVEYAGADGAWSDAWKEPVLPKAVRVSLTVADPDNPAHKQVARKAVFTIHVD